MAEKERISFDLELPKQGELEAAVLGYMLVDGSNAEGMTQMFDALNPEDFYYSQHKILFQLMHEAHKEGKEIDLLVLADKVKYSGYDGLIPVPDISELTSYTNIFTVRMALQRAKQIKDTALLRRSMTFFEEKAREAAKEPKSVREFVAEAEGQFVDLLDEMKDERPIDVLGITAEVEANIAHNKEKGLVGIDTGFRTFDNELGGMLPGHTWTVGAYTGTGKTHFGIQLAINALQNGGTVAFFSTEMDREGIYLRFLGNLARLSPMVLLRGMLTPIEEEQKEKALERIKEYQNKLFIFDNVYTIEEMRLKCKKLKIKHGLDLFILDFVQNIRGKGSLYERMSEAAVDIQSLAKEVRATAVIMSQVSNEGKAQEGKSDVLSYKGGGELAAVADVGLWISKVKDSKNKLEVKIAKARHGWSGTSFYIDVLYTQGARMTDGMRPDKEARKEDPLTANGL